MNILLTFEFIIVVYRDSGRRETDTRLGLKINSGQTRSKQSGSNSAVVSNLAVQSNNYKDKVNVENI